MRDRARAVAARLREDASDLRALWVELRKDSTLGNGLRGHLSRAHTLVGIASDLVDSAAVEYCAPYQSGA